MSLVLLLIALGVIVLPAPIVFQLGKRAKELAESPEPSMASFYNFPIYTARKLLGTFVDEPVFGADGKTVVRIDKKPVLPPGVQLLGGGDGFWYALFVTLFWPLKLTLNIPLYWLLGREVRKLIREYKAPDQRKLDADEQRAELEMADNQRETAQIMGRVRPRLPAGTDNPASNGAHDHRRPAVLTLSPLDPTPPISDPEP